MNQNNLTDAMQNPLNNNEQLNIQGEQNKASPEHENNFTQNQLPPNNEITPKKRNKGVLFAILIILIIALIGVLLTHHYVSNQNVFKILLNDSFNYLEKNIKDYKSISSTLSLKVNGTSTETSSNEIFEILNKMDISINYGIDYESKIFKMDIQSNYNNQKLINTNIYAEENNIYIYLEDLYDKYLKKEIENYESIFETIKTTDVKIILNSIQKSLLKSLKDEYFIQEDTKLEGQNLEKTTLILNRENCSSLKNDFIKDLLADEKFINSITKLTSKDVNEVKEELNEMLSSELSKEFSETKLSIYTANLSIKKFEISDNKNTLTITKNNERYDYKIVLENEEPVIGTFKLEKDNKKVLYSINISDEARQNIIEITASSTTEYDVTIAKNDISNNIDYNEITEEETEKIYQNIMKQRGIKEFITDLSNISSQEKDNDLSI